MENVTSTAFRVLLTKEPDKDTRLWWVAQCLEHDLAVQATSIQDAEYEIQRLIAARVAIAADLGVHPFKSVPPAPDEVWAEFNDKSEGLQLPRPQTFRLPDQLLTPYIPLEARVA